MTLERALKNPIRHDKDVGKKLKHKLPKLFVLTEAEKKELVEYYEKRISQLNIVKTTKTPSGQTLDWVKIDTQPHKGIIASPPPEIEAASRHVDRRVKVARFELQESGRRGPEGTVPILRMDVTKLRFNKTLDEHLSKHGHRTVTWIINGHALEQPEVGSPHDYGATSESVTCYGGEGRISLFDPYTAYSDEFSLSQIGLEGQSKKGRQTLEAGWQEYPDLYGDWIPHLFVYYTTNGYSRNGDKLGGYNQNVQGWVQYSKSVYPGAVSNNVSIPGGEQWELFIKYQLYQGNWWLNVGGEWIGYYPASLFTDPGLQKQADRILFFGEIVDSNSHLNATTTQMGTGYFAEREWPYAAFQRFLKYQNDINGSMTDYNGSNIVTDPKEYDTELHMNSLTDWESYFWFGGPGAH